MTESSETPKTPSKALRVEGAILAAFGGVCWLLPSLVFVFIAPKFEEIFRKFDIKGDLPQATSAVLAISHVWIWLLPIVLGLPVVLLILCIRGRSRAAIIGSIVYGVASFLICLVGMTWLVVSLFLPFVWDINNVGNVPQTPSGV